jgi:5'-deoxynucleotidase YfbR-like HD superfamily hydrolase
MIPQTVMYLYEAGGVQRYHTEPFGSQSVGRHTWGTMMLADQLFGPHLPDGLRLTLMRALLYHDTAERLTGDTPAPAKWLNPNLTHELGKAEREAHEVKGVPYVSASLDAPKDSTLGLLMKAADHGEAMIYCASQLHAGNRYAERPFQRLRNALRIVARELPHCAYGDETEWREALEACANNIHGLIQESMRLAYQPVNYCWEDN